MTEAQKRALNLKQEIEEACIRNNLNMTIYDGMIGFVDQSQWKIVMVWNPEYKKTGAE
nr:MAG TPA: hypothetical protein [Caudoviricetes sp.]